MGWFIGAFGVVEHPRSAGTMLERKFMALCMGVCLKIRIEGGRGTPVSE
jgi:hypothetical protein